MRACRRAGRPSLERLAIFVSACGYRTTTDSHAAVGERDLKLDVPRLEHAGSVPWPRSAAGDDRYQCRQYCLWPWSPGLVFKHIIDVEKGSQHPDAYVDVSPLISARAHVHVLQSVRLDGK